MVELGGGLWLVGWLLGLIAKTAARSLREFSRSTLEDLCRERGRPERFSDVLRRHSQVAESTAALAQVAIAVGGAGWGLVSLGLWQAEGAASWRLWAVLVGGAIAAPLVLVDFPAFLAHRGGEALIEATWPVWVGLHRGLSLCGFRIGAWLLGQVAPAEGEAPPADQFEDEIRTIVDEGHREGLLEENARGMIQGVMELRELEVSEIMTPRTDMLTLHVAHTLEEAARFVIEAGHSRIPVYDKNRDDVVGILYAKDLLEEFARAPGEPRRDLAAILRQPYFVPETKPVHALLQEFQGSRNHMAVALDEFGGVSGLITIEDVLEEIVGEIADEYDEAQVEAIKQLDERTAEVPARLHVDELNERLGLHLADDNNFDTVGGLVFNELGRIPRVGEVVTTGNVRITVLEVSRRRPERLKIEILDEAPSEPT